MSLSNIPKLKPSKGTIYVMAAFLATFTFFFTRTATTKTNTSKSSSGKSSSQLD